MAVAGVLANGLPVRGDRASIVIVAATAVETTGGAAPPVGRHLVGGVPRLPLATFIPIVAVGGVVIFVGGVVIVVDDVVIVVGGVVGVAGDGVAILVAVPLVVIRVPISAVTRNAPTLVRGGAEFLAIAG